MKVLNIEYQNFKNLENINIAVEGRSMIVKGRNRAGKSSMIDTIFDLLCNNEMAPDPIAKGQTEAYAAVLVGDDNRKYTVKKTFTEKNKKGYLSITTEDGAKFNSPVETLERLFGTISFDMDDLLASKNNDEMSKKLRAFLKIDTDKIDQEYKQTYDERKIINAEVKQLKEIINVKKIDKTLEVIDLEIAQKQKVIDDSSAIVSDIELINTRKEKGKALQTNKQVAIDEAKEKALKISLRIQGAKDEIQKAKDKIAELEQLILDSESSIQTLTEEAILTNSEIEKKTSLMSEIQSTFENIDLELENKNQLIAHIPVLKVEIDSLKKLKEEVEQIQQTKVKLSTKEKESSDLTAKLEKLQQDKRELFKANAGDLISFDDDGQVLYEGLPLHRKQLNTATLIQIAIELVLNSNPKFKAVKFDASQIDDITLKEIMSKIDKLGFQSFIERVDLDGGDLQINFIEQ